MDNIVFTTEYDKEIKIIKKSQAEINKDAIENGKIITKKTSISAITIPYINLEWNPSAKQKNNGKQRKLTKLHLNITFRQEVVICHELAICAYLVTYQHEMEHVQDNIVVFNEFPSYLKDNKEIIQLISQLFKWKTIAEIQSINWDIYKKIYFLFKNETIIMVEDLDTIETYRKLDKDIDNFCKIFNAPSQLLDSLPDFLTFGILSKGRGKRKGVDPRSRNSDI